MTTKDQEYQNNLTDLSDFLSQHVSDLTARIAVLEGKQAPAESEPVVDTSWPQDGDRYWCVDLRGDISRCIWESDSLDKSLAAHGKIFRTKEEAEKADQLCLAMHELKVMSEKEWANSGTRINWCNNPSQKKYYGRYNFSDDTWNILFTQTSESIGGVYFPTERSALDAIESINAKYPGVI